MAAYRQALAARLRSLPSCANQLARLLRAKGLLREAEQELTAALDAVPTYAEATLELATLRRRLGRASESLSLLIDLLQRDPYHFDALLALGETLLAMGRSVTRCTRSPACCASTHRTLALCSTKASFSWSSIAFDDAMDRWQRVIDLGPSTDYANAHVVRFAPHADLHNILSHAIEELIDGDRGTAPRARHPRRFSAARPEPEDGNAARVVGASRGRGLVFFDGGRVVHATVRSNDAPDGVVLLEAGRISETRSRARAARQSRPIGKEIVERSSRSARSRSASSSVSSACSSRTSSSS